MITSSPAGWPTLVTGLAVASYAALLTLLGFAGRRLISGRRREALAEERVRRRVKKLRRDVAQLRVDVRRGTDALTRVNSLAEDVAVLVSEVEALQAWQAAEQAAQRDGARHGPGVR